MEVMGQAAAPSESEVDLGVFAMKSGNILEELYEKSSKKKVRLFNIYSLLVFVFSLSLDLADISFGLPLVVPRLLLLTFLLFYPQRLPPTVVFGDSPICDSPPRLDPKGKGPEEVPKKFLVKNVSPPVVPGVVTQERVEGLETDYESSEATPPQGNHYTRHAPSTSGGRSRSDVQ
ncbi:hypothetical protein Hanom_Chr17g01525361 [Helianthus anomalus]